MQVDQTHDDFSGITLRARVRGVKAKIKGSRYSLPFTVIACTLTVIAIMHKDVLLSVIVQSTARGISDTGDDTERYLINTPGCAIQNFDVHSPQLSHLKRDYPKAFKCRDKRDLTEAMGLKLLLYRDRAEDYGVESSFLRCDYRGITAQADGAGILVSKPILGEPIDIADAETEIADEGILVMCFDAADVATPIYINVHYFVQPRKAEKKTEEFKRLYGDRQSQPDKLSVMLVGIDSLSRFNLIRHMTETYRYATEELGALDFRGYNKQGVNTLPNTMSFLLGMSRDEVNLTKLTKEYEGPYQTVYPAIWKDFADEGYVNAYGEDVSSSNFFNPHDIEYFQRVSFAVSQKHISHFIPDIGFTYAPCQGNKVSASVVYDYALDVARSLKDVPYFGFYWTCAITHDKIMMTKVVDPLVTSLLRTLNEEGILNHTVVFLVSDHGARFGRLRNTYLGNLEVNLPTFMAIFPPWFKKMFPRPWKNLVTNTRRLVSNFDFHQTLHDLASRDYVINKVRQVEPNHGQSLFREVPETRTCADVGIPPQLCACENYEDVGVEDPLVEEAAKFTIDYINEGLTKFPNCVPLRLEKVLSARISTGNNATKPDNEGMVVTVFLMVLQTQPASATFEALVRNARGALEVLGEIERTNRYGNQSHCINDDIYRQYCYCRDLLNA